MQVAFLMGLLAATLIPLTACTNGSQPFAPNGGSQPVAPTGIEAGGSSQSAEPSLTGATGVVRRLDVRGRRFLLLTRQGSHIVRADEETMVWRSGVRVRFASLQNGMSVGVRAIDRRDHLLARSIGIVE
jgi:hypothetical protein